MKLYDSLKGEKYSVVPMGSTFKLYVCGLTVYDEAHIGHLRTMLAFDLLVRILRFNQIDVMYVRNITDVDDKIIKRANEMQIGWQDLTQQVISKVKMQEGIFSLLEPDVEPKASEYIDEMIAMIKRLVDQGYAYVNADGDVCFRVSAYAEYGQLSKQNLQALEQSSRIDQGAKDSAHDFVLWKMSKPGEPTWSSPWGEGRPGWHIECSAMSTKILGETFDLHGGGLDLKFPHHENEIAQACCATGADFSKRWMHVGPLRVNGEKMSKSLGNFLTIDDALKRYHPELIRWYLLKTHYRMPMNFDEAGIEQAQRNLLGVYLCLRGEIGQPDYNHPSYKSFFEYLNDDLNVAGALGVLHDFASKVQTQTDRATLRAMLVVLGMGLEDPQAFLQQGLEAKEVEGLLAERKDARSRKDYERADQIRDMLSDKGAVVEDTAEGVFWYYNRAGMN